VLNRTIGAAEARLATVLERGRRHGAEQREQRDEEHRPPHGHGRTVWAVPSPTVKALV
jgi:hypothetical protein